MSSKSIPSKLFLWDKRTLYIGPLLEPMSLSQGASTLLISLEDEIEFQLDGLEKPHKSHSLLIPAGQSIYVDTRHQVVANCNLDPLCEDYFNLSQKMQRLHDGVYWNIHDLRTYQQAYITLRSEELTSDQAYSTLDGLLASTDQQPPFKIDTRVEQTINNIKMSVDDNVSVESLANAVQLSVPRLMQLFKEKTGIPIRRYRLWHRLYTAGLKVGQGHNITEAALLAGFTDSAHFSNTFKDMFGICPTKILFQPNGVTIFPPNSEGVEQALSLN